MSVIEEAIDVVTKRERTDSIVAGASVVMYERVSSNGRILIANGVEQQRCSANRGVVIRVVENERCGANSSIPASAGIPRE
jgi:hypothetical protein